MSSASRFLPGLLVAITVGVASGYYTFQPIIVEEEAIQRNGGLDEAQTNAELQGTPLLNTAIRKDEAQHKSQDRRIEEAAAITQKDKRQ